MRISNILFEIDRRCRFIVVCRVAIHDLRLRFERKRIAGTVHANNSSEDGSGTALTVNEAFPPKTEPMLSATKS